MRHYPVRDKFLAIYLPRPYFIWTPSQVVQCEKKKPIRFPLETG